MKTASNLPQLPYLGAVHYCEGDELIVVSRDDADTVKLERYGTDGNLRNSKDCVHDENGELLSWEFVCAGEMYEVSDGFISIGRRLSVHFPNDGKVNAQLLESEGLALAYVQPCLSSLLVLRKPVVCNLPTSKPLQKRVLLSKLFRAT
ncbi:MAG: hypothetical protein IPP17_01255 [Bacteroidetes bacterium]|nr:hypothetical protein [Bacteroidota bacterium]